jgi:hypothetical protein
MDGDCPGNLSLGQHTGDGRFDGETFLGGTWMFFSWADGGGEEEESGQVPLSRFRRTSLAFKQPHFLCYILYIEQWRFRCCMLQVIAKSALDLDALDRHVRTSGFDNPSTCSTY